MTDANATNEDRGNSISVVAEQGVDAAGRDIIHAQEIHNPIIYIVTGQRAVVPGLATSGLTAAEELLLERYRASPPSTQDAILRAALGG